MFLRSYKLLISFMLFSSLSFACGGHCDKASHCDVKDVTTVKHHSAIDAIKGKSKTCSTSYKSPFVKKLKHALKKAHITNDQWSDIKLSFKIFKDDMKELSHDKVHTTLTSSSFNKDDFIKHHPMQQKLALKAELIETIYLILNEDQKRDFAFAYKVETSMGQEKSMCHSSAEMCNKKEMCDTQKMCDKKAMCDKKEMCHTTGQCHKKGC